MSAHHQPAPALIDICRHDPASLINAFLIPKINGYPPHYDGGFVIYEDDVYSKPPQQLTTDRDPAPGTGGHNNGVWYFFSSLKYSSDREKRRALRVVDGGMGRWHSDRGRQEVGNEAKGWFVTKFFYMVKTAERKRERTGWVMEEYSCSGSDTVLCKVYHRPPRQARHHHQEEEPSAAAGSGKQQAIENHQFVNDDYDMLLAPIQRLHGENTEAFLLSYMYGGAAGGGGGEESSHRFP